MYLGVFVSIAAKESTMENDVGTVKKSRAASPAPRHQKPRKTRRWWNPARVRRKFPRWRKALRPRLTRRGPLWVVGGVFLCFCRLILQDLKNWHILTHIDLSSSSLAHVTSCPQSFTGPRALLSLQDFCMCFWLIPWPLQVASSRQHVFFLFGLCS